MPFIPFRDFGKFGIIEDTPAQALPVGTWSNGRNVRFTGVELQKMLEPIIESPLDIGQGSSSPCVDILAWGNAQPDIMALYRFSDTKPVEDFLFDESGNNRPATMQGDFNDWIFIDATADQTFECLAGQSTMRDNDDTHDMWPMRAVPDTGVTYPNNIVTLGAVVRVINVDPQDGNQQAMLHIVDETEAGGSFNSGFALVYAESGGGEEGKVYVQNDGGARVLTSLTYTLGVFQVIELQVDLVTGLITMRIDEQEDTYVGTGYPPGDYTGLQCSVAKEGEGFTYYHGEIDWHSMWIVGNATAGAYDAYANAKPAENLQGTEPEWLQPWSDGLSSYDAIATGRGLWMSRASSELDLHFVDVTRADGAYDIAGHWQSFPWGDTVIFNNGRDAPQMYDPRVGKFVDLPGWGLISTAQDIFDGTPPTRNVGARCKVLLPYKGFLVALGVTESGSSGANTVWWSNATSLATYKGDDFGGGPPSWDYESPATLSGKSQVGAGEGGITWGAVLNENLIIYTVSSATSMQAVGGSQVMTFRRLFNKGCADLHLAAEFNNQHFVISRDQVYIHDGSTVNLIAKDVMEDAFFKRAGKTGRFGGQDNAMFESMQVVKNPDRKEIHINFTQPDQIRTSMVWNFDDNNFTWMDASHATLIEATPGLVPVPCMAYGFDPGWVVRWEDLKTTGETWQDLLDEEPQRAWIDFYYHGQEENMYWLTEDNLLRADQEIQLTDNIKTYYAERKHLDLDDMVAAWTTNNFKHLKQFYFHLQSPLPDGYGPNTFDAQIGWSVNLMDEPTYLPADTINLQDTTNLGEYKWDFRTTGRYLAMRFDFTNTYKISLTGGDMDAEQAHGR